MAKRNFFAASALLASFLAGRLLFDIAAKGLADGARKVTDHAHVNGDVVLFRRASEREGMVLPYRHFWTAHENVLLLLVSNPRALSLSITYLASTGLGVLLLDLDLANIARVLNDFRDVRLVSSSNFTCNSFGQICETSIHPVFPEDTDSIAERRKVRLDHAEGAVDRPENEEDDEEMVCVPKALKVGSSWLFCSRKRDGH